MKDAAYDFLSYMSQPEQANIDVTIGKTGFNPYRISQFENLDLWLKAGMSKAAAENYLGRHQGQPQQSEHGARPARAAEPALRTGRARHPVARLLAGEIDVDKAATEIETGWNEATEELGKDAQLKAYRAALGVK